MSAETETPAAAVTGPVAAGGPQCPRPAIGAWGRYPQRRNVGQVLRPFAFCSLHADETRKAAEMACPSTHYVHRDEYRQGQTSVQCRGIAFDPEAAADLLAPEVLTAAADVRTALSRLSRLTAVAEHADRTAVVGCERQVLVELAQLQHEVKGAFDVVALRNAYRVEEVVAAAAAGEA